MQVRGGRRAVAKAGEVRAGSGTGYSVTCHLHTFWHTQQQASFANTHEDLAIPHIVESRCLRRLPQYILTVKVTKNEQDQALKAPGPELVSSQLHLTKVVTHQTEHHILKM